MACPLCDGFKKVTCPKCSGDGQVEDGSSGQYKTCPMCDGYRKVTCPRCNGSGEE